MWHAVGVLVDSSLWECCLVVFGFSSLHAWRSFACIGLNVTLVVGGAGGLLIGFFGAVLHCLCMLCMMCKAPHCLVYFPFFSGCLWFLSTWGVPLGSLALQSLWMQSLSVCFCCFRLLVLPLGELFSLRVQEVIECFWQRLLVGYCCRVVSSWGGGAVHLGFLVVCLLDVRVASALPYDGLAGWMLGLAVSWFFLSFWLVFSACILLAFRFCFF